MRCTVLKCERCQLLSLRQPHCGFRDDVTGIGCMRCLLFRTWQSRILRVLCVVTVQCAVLIMLYHRDATQEHGFSQETAKCFGAFYGFLSILGCFVYLTFVISAVVMVVQVRALFCLDRVELPENRQFVPVGFYCTNCATVCGVPQKLSHSKSPCV